MRPVMDGNYPGSPGPAEMTLLQRLITDRRPERRPLYWRDSLADAGAAPCVACGEAGALHVGPGGVLSFDTYFNAFFEAQWHRHTSLRTVMLRITLSAPATLRIHRLALGRKTLVREQAAGAGTAWVGIESPAINFRQHGLLCVELSAVGEEGFTFVAGAWLTEDSPAASAALAAVVCTFNREAEVGRALRTLGSDQTALDRLCRVFVVNQGRPGLLRHPEVADAADRLGRKLAVIEQGNFGGSGGFSRGLLAGLDDPAITHVVLLDDDVELEPDSLLRMAAFFAFCHRDIVLGGHMLDLLHPTTLYEAGAIVSPAHWEFLPQHFGRPIAEARELEPLSHPYAVHYNGWWCCGIPLAVVREHGMPLPCFIRGDDLEFGMRLHQRGVPTVPMPGIAVWHEPFYLKLGGWQLYYETRNMLVTAALHQPFGRAAVVRRMARQIVVHLLTYRYYATALILKGIEDFLAGPAVMREPPLPRHASLGQVRQQYRSETMARETVSHQVPLQQPPRGRLGCLALLAWLLLRNALLPSSKAPPGTILVEKLDWIALRRASHFATETWWDDRLPSYRRTREYHRPLLRQAVGLLIRLVREAPRAAEQWRAAAPHLTSIAFWHDYLGMSHPVPAAPDPAMTDGD